MAKLIPAPDPRGPEFSCETKVSILEIVNNHDSITVALQRLRKGDCEFWVSLGYIVKPHLKIQGKESLRWLRELRHLSSTLTI